MMMYRIKGIKKWTVYVERTGPFAQIKVEKTVEIIDAHVMFFMDSGGVCSSEFGAPKRGKWVWVGKFWKEREGFVWIGNGRGKKGKGRVTTG